MLIIPEKQEVVKCLGGLYMAQKIEGVYPIKIKGTTMSVKFVEVQWSWKCQEMTFKVKGK